MSAECTTAGCGSVTGERVRGMCNRCYGRWHRHGDPLAGGAYRVSPGVPLAFYLAHVDDQTDACVTWPYGTDGNGYGRVKIDGKERRVHVLSCERHHGPPPPGKPEAAHAPVICHNILCFNGRHLSWGDRQTQFADMVLDGTDNRGEAHYRAKFTRADIRTIRSRYAAGGITQRELAAEYGVIRQTIGKVVRGKAWKEGSE